MESITLAGQRPIYRSILTMGSEALPQVLNALGTYLTDSESLRIPGDLGLRPCFEYDPRIVVDERWAKGLVLEDIRTDQPTEHLIRSKNGQLTVRIIRLTEEDDFALHIEHNHIEREFALRLHVTRPVYACSIVLAAQPQAIGSQLSFDLDVLAKRIKKALPDHAPAALTGDWIAGQLHANSSADGRIKVAEYSDLSVLLFARLLQNNGQWSSRGSQLICRPQDQSAGVYTFELQVIHDTPYMPLWGPSFADTAAKMQQKLAEAFRPSLKSL